MNRRDRVELTSTRDATDIEREAEVKSEPQEARGERNPRHDRDRQALARAVVEALDEMDWAAREQRLRE